MPRQQHVLTVVQAPSPQVQQVLGVHHVELASTVPVPHIAQPVHEAKRRVSLEPQIQLHACLVLQGIMRPMKAAAAAHHARQVHTVTQLRHRHVVSVAQASMQWGQQLQHA